MAKEFKLYATEKAVKPATKKQYDYLKTFENVDLDISTSAFLKFVSIGEASEAIETAKSGGIVEIWR